MPGWTARLPVPARLEPSPDDPISAARLALRLDALARALDDLPRHARRFARLKARLDADARDGRAPARFRRLAPLRGGPPPGSSRSGAHQVHDVLAHAHELALYALERPDTS